MYLGTSRARASPRGAKRLVRIVSVEDRISTYFDIVKFSLAQATSARGSWEYTPQTL